MLLALLIVHLAETSPAEIGTAMSAHNEPRQFTLLDSLVGEFDKALRTLTKGSQPHSRPTPSTASQQETSLSEAEKKLSASLMRVNHTGEVCAQALYQGQALTAKLPEVRQEMQNAADEEQDHLAWCEQRVNELGSHTSYLNPLWYGMSFTIGAAAGMISDKVSLGFVAATEEQVCKHLNSHLAKLPENDTASRIIVEQMLVDEAKHAHTALEAGGYHFPTPIKWSMTAMSRLMTETSFYI